MHAGLSNRQGYKWDLCCGCHYMTDEGVHYHSGCPWMGLGELGENENHCQCNPGLRTTLP